MIPFQYFIVDTCFHDDDITLDECSKQDIHFANATIVEDPLTAAFNSDYRRRAAMTTTIPRFLCQAYLINDERSTHVVANKYK
jgi:hypothetical protein